MKSKKLLVGLITIGFLLGFTGILMAGSSATPSVSFGVSEINELSVSGSVTGMTVSTATAGSEPDQVTDDSTTYAITTNAGTDAKKITALIDSAMPSGLTLKINLAAPSEAVSAGDVDLSNATSTALDVVTGIDSVAASGNTITYKVNATVAAGVLTSTERTVTLTIADAS